MKPTIATNNTRVKTAITPMTMGITSGLSFCFLDVEKGDAAADGLVDVFVTEVEGREEDVEDKGDVEVTVVELSFSEQSVIF